VSPANRIGREKPRAMRFETVAELVRSSAA
jgi:hypothetical protein